MNNEGETGDTNNQDGKIEGNGPSLSQANTANNMDPNAPAATSAATEDKNDPASGAKIFIGGLSWKTTEDTLLEYFKQFDDVISVEIMICRRTGQPRGFGFVTIKNKPKMESICAMAHIIDARKVEVKPSVKRDRSMVGADGVQETRKIFVGGVATDITDSTLKEYFSKFGEVLDASIMIDRSTKRSRGFGFVTFADEASVDRAITEDRHKLGDKAIEVKKARPRVQQRPHNYMGMGHMHMAPFHNPGMHGPGGMHYDGMIYGMMGAGMGPGGDGRPPEAFSYPDAAFMAQPQAFNPEYMHAYNAPMGSPAFMMLERGRMHGGGMQQPPTGGGGGGSSGSGSGPSNANVRGGYDRATSQQQDQQLYHQSMAFASAMGGAGRKGPGGPPPGAVEMSRAPEAAFETN